MSDLPFSMVLEMVPNEILIEIFGYLNALEIFAAFDRLNHRFDRLIRTIFLHLNFDHIRKDLFDDFCTTMRAQPSIKRQISSLELSNRGTCGQIELFLSLFSLAEFSSIRTLAFIDLEQKNIETFQPILPSMFELRTLHLTMEKNQLFKQSIFTRPSAISHLTISTCSLNQLFDHILNYTPRLKYLHVQYMFKSYSVITKTETLQLRQVIIDHIEYAFDELQILLQATPNLRRLAISAFDNISMIDARSWQRLIQSFLPSLRVFQWVFGLYCKGKVRMDIIPKFHQFQSPFWLEEHRWPTEYVLDTNAAVIYTTPYPNSVYRLTPTAEKSNGKLDGFEKVTNLVLCYGGIPERRYYSNVESLTLESVLTVDSLRKVVNFYHLKHLDISAYLILDSSSFLELLKVSPQLSSIALNACLLLAFVGDRELRQYLHQRVKRLSISEYAQHLFDQFGEIFVNLEQLTCEINGLEQVLMLLNSLTKLSSIDVSLPCSDQPEQIACWLRKEISNFNVIYRIHHCHFNANTPREFNKTELCIWTGGVKTS